MGSEWGKLETDTKATAVLKKVIVMGIINVIATK